MNSGSFDDALKDCDEDRLGCKQDSEFFPDMLALVYPC